jgi:hypothetical protein
MNPLVHTIVDALLEGDYARELIRKAYGIVTPQNIVDYIMTMAQWDIEDGWFTEVRHEPKDHLVRRADGGTGQLDNLVVACRKCNNERHQPGWQPPLLVDVDVKDLALKTQVGGAHDQIGPAIQDQETRGGA